MEALDREVDTQTKEMEKFRSKGLRYQTRMEQNTEIRNFLDRVHDGQQDRATKRFAELLS